MGNVDECIILTTIQNVLKKALGEFCGGEYCAAGESIYWCILLVERDANGSNLTNEKPRCSVMSADSMPSKDS